MALSLDKYGLPDRTDGPERFRGGPLCPEHHRGFRTGHRDWCCCCNPCLYELSPFAKSARENIVAPWELRGACCKCFPQAICMVFTPDASNDECCRELGQIAFAQHQLVGTYTTDMAVEYTFSFNLGDYLTISIEPSHDPNKIVNFPWGDSSYFPLGPCSWHIRWPPIYLDDQVEIDHVDVTCLTPPAWEITGVTDVNGCIGTLRFVPYNGDKVPFFNQWYDRLPHYDPPYSPIMPPVPGWTPYPLCQCTEPDGAGVARILCVTGVRHIPEGDEEPVFESVAFGWNEDLNDRWEYLPPCGNPSTDTERIYLRGDEEGNCYLELDFEQAGPWTNDWADPPNTLGPNIHEIRDGMLAIESCSCRMLVKSETTGGRYVTITTGPCARFDYICETCRCVPSSICVFGRIDGQLLNTTRLEWDDTLLRWVGTAGGQGGYNEYSGELRIGITENACEDCVGMIDNDNFVTPFEIGNVPIRCDKFLTFELESAYDPSYPDRFNWIWISSGICTCVPHRCGVCAEERCGGPPRVLYCHIEAQYIIHGTSLTPGETGPLYELDVTLHYFERWSTPGPPFTLECGYIGTSLVQCDSTTYAVTVQIVPVTNFIHITKKDLSTGTVTYHFQNVTFTPSYCDPIYFEIPRPGVGFAVSTWICGDATTEASITIME